MKPQEVSLSWRRRLYSNSRRNTMMLWSGLILVITAWSIYNIQQHEQANAMRTVEGYSLQGDVLAAWATSHTSTAHTAATERRRLDDNRHLIPINRNAFSLEISLENKTVSSVWVIDSDKLKKKPISGAPIFTEQSRDHQSYYTITRNVPAELHCAGCHNGQAMSYSVTLAGNDEHKRVEIISLSAGYLMLLMLGITLSSLSHNKLARSSRTRQVYEEKLHEQYESQKAIAEILELAISNYSLTDKLNSVLDILSRVAWLKTSAQGLIFTVSDGQLMLAAPMGVSERINTGCHQVRLGECLCGTAANSKVIQYTPDVGLRHNAVACKAEVHGHYSIPITHEGELLGLLALLVESGHQGTTDEIKFLTAVGNSLGGMIHKGQMEQRLRYDAYHDQLTALGNRALLGDRVNACIKRSRRDADSEFCLLFLDLDRFKHINDSLGHHIGDHVLIETARRLKLLLRDGDTIARLGGDEFVILLDQVENLQAAYRIAARVHQTIENNIQIESYDLFTTCSIGIAYYSDSYSNFEQMLRDADIAMYMAKSSNTDKTVTFDHHMHQSALKNMSIESSLRLACIHRELIVHFQPIYSTRKQRFIGAEALVRWRRNGIMMQPGEFINIAEDSGIIIMLGEYVLDEACRMITTLLKGSDNNDFYISVNISAKQMFNRNLIESIDTILENNATPTRHLRLEITESLFADNSPLVAEHLGKIKARGIKLLIDDFGTGYSSLSFLHNHPFDCVKIDRSFITRISAPDINHRSQKLIKTITELARNLEMSVIAEGVENKAQLDYLSGIGCDLIQGYYFSRPLDPASFLQTFTTAQPPHEAPQSHPSPEESGPHITRYQPSASSCGHSLKG